MRGCGNLFISGVHYFVLLFSSDYVSSWCHCSTLSTALDDIGSVSMNLLCSLPARPSHLQ